jgi:hypothetical protein
MSFFGQINKCQLIGCGCETCRSNPIDKFYGDAEQATFHVRIEGKEPCSVKRLTPRSMTLKNKTHFEHILELLINILVDEYENEAFEDHQAKLVITNKNNKKLIYSVFQPNRNNYQCFACLDRIKAKEMITLDCGHQEHKECYSKMNHCYYCSNKYHVRFEVE